MNRTSVIDGVNMVFMRTKLVSINYGRVCRLPNEVLNATLNIT